MTNIASASTTRNYFSSAWNYLEKHFTSVMKVKTPPLLNCGSEGAGTADQEWTPGSGAMPPVKIPPSTGDAGVSCRDSGACVIDNGATIVLSLYDGGMAKLPDDIFNAPLSTGDRAKVIFNKYQDAHGITFESKPLYGQNLQGLDLQMLIGSNSAPIPGMPAGACYPGLIKSTQIPTVDLADAGVDGGDNIKGCPEPGYEKFLSCPSDKNSRLNVYVEKVTMIGYQFVNGQNVPIGDPVVLTLTDLASGDAMNPQVNWASGYLLPAACGANPQFLTIPIPAAFKADGSLYMKLKIDLLVQAVNYDPKALYETGLDVHFDKVTK
jgi:hypothetical protein